MIIIIDGYNLLRQVFSKVKGQLDKQRKQLVKQLGYYKKQKANQIKQIILVFDGGLLNHATREVHQGVVVVFAGQKSNADEWILDYTQRNKEKQMLLVTLDRELIEKTKRYGADAISVFDFYKILQNSLLQEAVDELVLKGGDFVKKYDSEKIYYDELDAGKKAIDSQVLDLLMEQFSYRTHKKDGVLGDQRENRKCRSKKLSKKERGFLRKIKKL